MRLASKTQFVETIRERFNQTPMVILTDWKGCTVEELNALRRSCETAGVHFQVVKNTLCKRAVSDTPMEPLQAYFKGNIGVLFAGEDPIAAAKLYKEQRAENSKLVCRAGFFEGTVLDEKGVEAVASLPSREELISTLLRTMQEGPRQVLGVIHGPGRDLVNVLQNYAAKLEA